MLAEREEDNLAVVPEELEDLDFASKHKDDSLYYDQHRLKYKDNLYTDHPSQYKASLNQEDSFSSSCFRNGGDFEDELSLETVGTESLELELETGSAASNKRYVHSPLYLYCTALVTCMFKVD